MNIIHNYKLGLTGGGGGGIRSPETFSGLTVFKFAQRITSVIPDLRVSSSDAGLGISNCPVVLAVSLDLHIHSSPWRHKVLSRISPKTLGQQWRREDEFRAGLEASQSRLLPGLAGGLSQELGFDTLDRCCYTTPIE